MLESFLIIHQFLHQGMLFFWCQNSIIWRHIILDTFCTINYYISNNLIITVWRKNRVFDIHLNKLMQASTDITDRNFRLRRKYMQYIKFSGRIDACSLDFFLKTILTVSTYRYFLSFEGYTIKNK